MAVFVGKYKKCKVSDIDIANIPVSNFVIHKRMYLQIRGMRAKDVYKEKRKKLATHSLN